MSKDKDIERIGGGNTLSELHIDIPDENNILYLSSGH